MVLQSSLTQPVNLPTPNQGSILDLVLTNLEDNIFTRPLNSTSLILSSQYYLFTDHLCLPSQPPILHLIILRVNTKSYMII